LANFGAPYNRTIVDWARTLNATIALHSPLFDIDEPALAVGAKILAQAAVLAADPARKGLRHDEDLIPVEPGAHARR
jgi:hypothetical protein